MENIKRYNQVFIETLNVKESELSNLEYHSVPLWDSVGHMALIAAIEETFDIMMETDDIIDFSSYEKGIVVLKNKYEIGF
jgi:acyl carrier protein